MGSSFREIPGKFMPVEKDGAVSEQGRWQYFMHNVVKGRKIGWYDYEEAGAKNMEKFWALTRTNERLMVRIIKTDHFKYEVDFGNMLQTNIKTGTRRAIRRVSPGVVPSSAPPDIIPEPVKGIPESEEEDDDREDDDEEDDVTDEDATDVEPIEPALDTMKAKLKP